MESFLDCAIKYISETIIKEIESTLVNVFQSFSLFYANNICRCNEYKLSSFVNLVMKTIQEIILEISEDPKRLDENKNDKTTKKWEQMALYDLKNAFKAKIFPNLKITGQLQQILNCSDFI